MSDYEYDELTAPRRRWLLPGVLVAFGILALLAGLAFSPVAAAARSGLFRSHGHDPEAMHERLDFAADWILSRIDASEAQSDRIKDILAQSIDDMHALRGDHEALHEAIVSKLVAPEVDRAALEKMRSEQLARFDTASQQITEAIADIAEVLSVEQRQELVALAERFHGRRHGGRHGGWH